MFRTTVAAEPTPIRPLSTPPVAVPPLPEVGVDVNVALRWALAVPLLGVLAVAVMYGVGAALKAAQFREAGLEPSEVLPMVPFWTLVTGGLNAALFALALAPLVLAAAFLLGRLLRENARKDHIDDVVARLVADHEQLRQELHRVTSAADDDHFGRRLRRLDNRAGRVRETVKHRRWIAIGAVAASVVLLAFLLSPATLMAALVSILLASKYRWDTGRIVAMVFAALLLAVLVERFAAPPPAPEAAVRTTTGVLVEGKLVASTVRGTYIATEDGVVRSIPQRQIARSSARPESHSSPKPLGQRLTDLF
jgi:hypothetical protein